MKGLAELVPPSPHNESVDEHMWINERTAQTTPPCFSQGQTSRVPPNGPCGRRGRGISRRQKGIRERYRERCRGYTQNTNRGEFQTQRILQDVDTSLSS